MRLDEADTVPHRKHLSLSIARYLNQIKLEQAETLVFFLNFLELQKGNGWMLKNTIAQLVFAIGRIVSSLK